MSAGIALAGGLDIHRGLQPIAGLGEQLADPRRGLLVLDQVGAVQALLKRIDDRHGRLVSCRLCHMCQFANPLSRALPPALWRFFGFGLCLLAGGPAGFDLGCIVAGRPRGLLARPGLACELALLRVGAARRTSPPLRATAGWPSEGRLAERPGNAVGPSTFCVE